MSQFKWIEVAPVKGDPQSWTCYAVAEQEGDIFTAVFEGPEAKARAEEYATFKYGAGTWSFGKDWNALVRSI